MKFSDTAIQGPVLVELDAREDSRGWFARSFCREEFESHGLIPAVVQCNVSFNHLMGTLRGMHYQVSPHEEAKLVRCTKGSVFDVIIDMRPGSPTYREHLAVDLAADNHRALYVPPLFAHGYQALEDGTEVFYQCSREYTPGAEAGLRFDDPALDIAWPLAVTSISEKDAAWPLLSEAGGTLR